jgi:hypothetical protein
MNSERRDRDCCAMNIHIMTSRWDNPMSGQFKTLGVDSAQFQERYVSNVAQ